MGYSAHNKAYKCFNKHLKKVIDSVNVRVDEDLQKAKKNVENQIEEMCYEDEEQSENEEEVTNKP